jgi:predicted nucleic acid-binding protein
MQNNILNKVIISDTSCLIVLTNTGNLEILKQVYGSIVITPEVSGEYGEPLPDWITVEPVVDKERIKLIQQDLDLGESSSIALAMEMNNSLLILDDGHARDYVTELGLKMTGTLGTLIAAYRKGFLKDIKSVVDDMKIRKFRLPKDVDKIVDDVIKEINGK